MSRAPATRTCGRPVLVYDGDCGLCTRAAQAARRVLRLPHVEPWQQLDLDALGLTADACDAAVQWVDAGGGAVSGERAVIAALRHAGGPWAVLGGALGLPGVRTVAGVVYRWVARNRARLPGGTAACDLPEH